MGKEVARTEIPPGTLYMLILRSLARLGPMHGYGIAPIGRNRKTTGARATTA